MRVNNKEMLAEWIVERENILARKSHGFNAPWTDNAVMQTTYFCNVHREDDKVTKWIRKRWDDAHSMNAVDIADVEANMCMARLVNRISSLESLDWPWDKWQPKRFQDVAEMYAREGDPFWGSAYVVTTHGQPIGKVGYVSGVLQEAFKQLPITNTAYTLTAYHKRLTALEGFGSFMAAQVVADLKNTDYHPLREARDWHTWSAPGPGSLRGLTWFFDAELKGKKVTPRTFGGYIREAWDWARPKLPPGLRDLCMQDFQNCLCEYDKFMRVTTGTGKSKRKYRGEG